MNSQLILAHIRQFITLTEDEAQFLDSVLIVRPFKQGEIIVESGDAARYLAFVNEGYTVTYFTDQAGSDHVVRFAASGWWSGDVYSLGKEPKTPLTTKGLCSGELLLLPRSTQDKLFEKYPKFEGYFRQLFQTALIRHQMLFVESRSTPAKQRYLKFLQTFPGIEQHLLQKYIASFLGITPEFLSKIRKRLMSGES